MCPSAQQQLPVALHTDSTQALNVLMLKTLENCERTAAFTALLLLTRDAPPDVRQKAEASARFFDLAVKCLIKISKALSDDLQVPSPLSPRDASDAQLSAAAGRVRWLKVWGGL